HMAEYFPGGYLIPEDGADTESDEPFRTRGIVEKPHPADRPSHWVTLVAHYIPSASELAAALDTYLTADPVHRYALAVTSLIGRRDARGVPHRQASASMKYPWNVLDVMRLALRDVSDSQIHATARIASGAVLRGPVVIGAHAQIKSGAVIAGPAYVG